MVLYCSCLGIYSECLDCESASPGSPPSKSGRSSYKEFLVAEKNFVASLIVRITISSEDEGSAFVIEAPDTDNPVRSLEKDKSFSFYYLFITLSPGDCFFKDELY